MSKPVYLYITPFFPSPKTWQGGFCMDAVKALRADGRYEVVVMTATDYGGDYEIEGIKVYQFPRRRIGASEYLEWWLQGRNNRSFLAKLVEIALVVVQYNMDIKGYIRHVAQTKRVFDIAGYREGADLKCLEKFSGLIEDKASVMMLGNDCDVYRRLGVSPRGYYAYVPDDFNGKVKETVWTDMRAHTNRYIITNNMHVKPYYRVVLEETYDNICNAGDYKLWEARNYNGNQN